MRIVSLLPSCTEMVYALGEKVVGRSHECDWPEEVKKIKVMTKPKINATTSSSEINNQITNLVKQGLSVYDIDVQALKEAKPDVILTQDQCEVCAVSLEDVMKAVNTEINTKVKIISLKPMKFNDILDDILKVGEAVGKKKQAQQAVEQISKRKKYITDKTHAIGYMPKVACIEWIDPIMAAGNWMPEMIEMCGGISVTGEAGKHSLRSTLEEIAEKRPEKIIIAPCGFSVEQSLRDINILTENPLWQNIEAVKQGNVYAVDGNSYFNRPGPRIIDSLEIMAGIIWPEIFGEFITEDERIVKRLV